jgi:hypothetical protein
VPGCVLLILYINASPVESMATLKSASKASI